MTKPDFKKQYKNLFSPSSKEVSLVTVPEFQYLMVDGKGEPDGSEAQEAFKILFPVAYKLKFLMKTREKDYGVMPLEGLWWADKMEDFVNGRRDRWQWTYMIMQPDFITKDDVNTVIENLKKKDPLLNFNNLRFEKYHEGLSAQILHIGPFSTEATNIKRIHDFIKENGGQFDGHKNKHHEIYLSDYRRVTPEKMKTILRQPFHK
jgi:hypothetical protein